MLVLELFCPVPFYLHRMYTTTKGARSFNTSNVSKFHKRYLSNINYQYIFIHLTTGVAQGGTVSVVTRLRTEVCGVRNPSVESIYFLP
jgi:hypothetical protein